MVVELDFLTARIEGNYEYRYFDDEFNHPEIVCPGIGSFLT